MIRMVLFAAILIAAVDVKAQAPLSFGTQPAYTHFRQVADSSNTFKKKCFFTNYVGLSTGFFGGGGNFLSAPLGVQINRQLNKNLFAFAGVSVAPAYFHYSNMFYQPVFNKNNGFMNANNFGTYSSAHLGLMYVNDERTFSISGSIGVSRYNTYSPYYVPARSPVLNH